MDGCVVSGGRKKDNSQEVDLPVVSAGRVVDGLVLDQRHPDLLGLLPATDIASCGTASLLDFGLTLLEGELEVCCWVVHHAKLATGVGLDAAVVHSLADPGAV